MREHGSSHHGTTDCHIKTNEMPPIHVNIAIERDGTAWCAHFDDFINLQESDAGFGDTTFEAVIKLLCTETAQKKL